MTMKARWSPAYIGVGSNLQSPARQVEAAIGQLAEVERTRVIRASSLYRSAPFGGIEQPDFVNAVTAVLTQLDPSEMLAALHGIEAAHGRERDDTRWGPRVLDLDLLVYSDRRVESPELTIPHPGIGERNFVLLPLGEIAPELVIPGLGRVASIPVNRSEPSISRIV